MQLAFEVADKALVAEGSAGVGAPANSIEFRAVAFDVEEVTPGDRVPCSAPCVHIERAVGMIRQRVGSGARPSPGVGSLDHPCA